MKTNAILIMLFITCTTSLLAQTTGVDWTRSQMESQSRLQEQGRRGEMERQNREREREWERMRNSNSSIPSTPSRSAEQYCSSAIDHLLKKDYVKAIAGFTEAIRLDPSNEVYYFWCGVSHYYNKNYDQAISDFSESIRLNPSNAGCYDVRGDSHNSNKNYEQAIADWETVLSLNQNHPKAGKKIEEAKQQLGR